MKQRVKLETEAGELVTEGLVLAFQARPVVLTWGTRVFVFDRAEGGAERVDVYRERFHAPLLETITAPVVPASAVEAVVCPRRDELGGAGIFKLPASDHFRADGTCSYCGSLAPDEFMRQAAEGVELTPTDKSYKVYVGGSGKFYFQHLSKEQMQRFVELHNAKTLKLAYPGRFYVWPFFMVPA